MDALVDRTPLNRFTTLRGGDADELVALLRGKDFKLSMFKRDPDRASDARINAVDLPNIHLCYVSYGAAAITTAPPRDDYRIQLPLSGQSVTELGSTAVTCRDAQAIVVSPNYEQVVRCSADCSRLLVYFPHDALNRHLSALLGEGIAGRIEFAPTMDLDTGVGRGLRRWLYLAIDEFGHSDGLMTNPLALAHFEELLLTGLVCGQPHNYSGTLRRPIAVSPRSVKRAIDYIRANLHLPITVEQLVAAAGVPGRTLYKHFRHTTGLAPLAYVRKVRYERVRQELMNRTGESLTAIATRWGFEHMGRFAQGYRALFGERPSETLRRR